jgi:hypothetical protein
MRILRASEIGTYVYCQRAWWYQKNGFESQNLDEMSAGVDVHLQHGRGVLFTGLLRTIAYGLLFAALVLGVIAIVLQALG